MTIEVDRDVVDRRLVALGLAASSFATPEEVVRWMGVVQSQDYGPAKWSIAQRMTGSANVTDAGIERAFNEGRILRTHVLRPTWHFVAPEDIRWLVELTGPRIQALSAYMYRTTGLDEVVRARSNHVVAAALEGGRHLTRAELRNALATAGIATDGFRLGYLLMYAEVTGLICSGPLRGKAHTYALLEERARQARRLTHEEALAELTRRYFLSHGPATIKDFRMWCSLSAADAGHGLAMVGSELERETFRDLTWWSGPAGLVPLAPSPTVHLLQGYDEYVMGYTETRSLLDMDGSAAYSPTDRAIYVGVVMLDGQLAGHWKRTPGRAGVVIDVQLRIPFDDAQSRALRVAADRHGEFLGLPATLATTAIETGR